MEQAVKEQKGEIIEHEDYTTPAGEALTPMGMLDRAVQQGASMEVLEKLMGLQERHEANQARKAFDNAIAAAKAEIPNIAKNRTVDFTSTKGRTNYRHEDLGEIARVVGPILAKHGLSYRFRTSSLPNEPVTVTCVVSHRDGHCEENTLSAGKDESGNKNSIQAVGSTITYLQRYTLKAALGLAASNDDDASTADAGPRISEAQMTDLIELCEEVGADRTKVCEFYGIESLADVPANAFEKVKATIEKKRSAS